MRYTLADVIAMLKRHGTPRHRSWVQWLIQTGRVDLPHKDASGRFCFEPKHFRQILAHADARQETTR
jgi:hypothetical protein